MYTTPDAQRIYYTDFINLPFPLSDRALVENLQPGARWLRIRKETDLIQSQDFAQLNKNFCPIFIEDRNGHTHPGSLLWGADISVSQTGLVAMTLREYTHQHFLPIWIIVFGQVQQVNLHFSNFSMLCLNTIHRENRSWFQRGRESFGSLPRGDLPVGKYFELAGVYVHIGILNGPRYRVVGIMESGSFSRDGNWGQCAKIDLQACLH